MRVDPKVVFSLGADKDALIISKVMFDSEADKDGTAPFFLCLVREGGNGADPTSEYSLNIRDGLVLGMQAGRICPKPAGLTRAEYPRSAANQPA